MCTRVCAIAHRGGIWEECVCMCVCTWVSVCACVRACLQWEGKGEEGLRGIPRPLGGVSPITSPSLQPRPALPRSSDSAWAKAISNRSRTAPGCWNLLCRGEGTASRMPGSSLTLCRPPTGTLASVWAARVSHLSRVRAASSRSPRVCVGGGCSVDQGGYGCMLRTPSVAGCKTGCSLHDQVTQVPPFQNVPVRTLLL